jgi:hypothetical protein
MKVEQLRSIIREEVQSVLQSNRVVENGLGGDYIKTYATKEKFDKLSDYDKSGVIANLPMGELVKNVPQIEIENAVKWLKDNMQDRSMDLYLRVFWKQKIEKLEKALNNKKGYNQAK